MEVEGALWASPPMRTALANDDVGTVIRLARRAANLNQTQLGRLCDYSVSTISRIERGQPPSQDIHVRRRIAAALNIPAQYLGLARRHDTAVPVGVSVEHFRVDSHATGAGGVRVGATTAGRGDPVRRRELLSGLAATAATAAWPWRHEPGPAAQRLADLLAASTVEAQPEPPWIFRRENQLRSSLLRKEMGNGDGEAAQVVYAGVQGAGRPDGGGGVSGDPVDGAGDRYQ
jgi:transcriptional regulator with XRE-family HTH domain